MADPQPLEALAQVARTLDELRVLYAIGGSYASSLYGELRITRDADLIVSLSPDQVEPLAGRLEAEFYVSRSAMREAVRDRRSFNVVHLATNFKLDFFIVGATEFDRSELDRRVLQTLLPGSDLKLWFKSAEDTLLRKLLWYRQGGEVAEQQLKDVVGVMARMRGRLDEGYVDAWARRLGIDDLVDRARRLASS